MNTPPSATARHWVSPVAEVGPDDAALVGGKAANLGELIRAGFPVPPAFVITTAGYLDAMARAGVRDSLWVRPVETSTDDDAPPANDRQEIVRRAGIPDEMSREILAAYRELGPPTTRVAVRSSAPAEDAADTSYAGIHESFTNVAGAEKLLEAVGGCWASLWSRRALAYRSLHCVRDEPSLAVVVQLMVDTDRSGVMFTADPRDGDTHRVLIEAAAGLGEVVVGGQVEPDTYVVSKTGLEVVETHIGSQNFAITGTAEGEQKTEIPPARRGDRVLAAAEIRQLASVAIAVEDHYQVPQDIEFAFAGSTLWLVQSRPITTLDQRRAGPSGSEKADEDDARVLARGLGAGPGAATGRVRVLHSVADGQSLAPGEILVATMTRPDWLPILRRAGAIVTDGGGITCHAAIVGRELGKPVIVGARTATADLVDGALVTVDGSSGTVFAGHPAAAAASAPVTRTEERAPAPFAASRHTTATTVYANFATPEAAERVAAMDVDGVGLLRAEFMIMDALDGVHPATMLARGLHDAYVSNMSTALSRIAAAFGNRPVIYRAIDLRTNEFSNLQGGEVEPHEDNPMIGYRGCFRYVREPALFALDLDVIAETRKQHRNVHLMIPFVRTGWELSECLAQLNSHPLGSDRRMLRWIMAEVPSVVHWIPKYAEMGIHGISIGTNDLTQLMLGVDRDSVICEDLFDAMDPAVLEAIDMILERAAGAGMTTSLCGQAVSTDHALAEHLVRKGITSVSVAPDAVDATRRAIAMAEQRIILGQALSGEH